MAESAKTPRSRTPKPKTAAARSRKPAASGRLVSINPATGAVLAEIDPTPPGDVAEIVAQARKVAPEWAAIDPRGRVRMLREVRYRIADLVDEIVAVVSAENGKPRVEALTHDVLPTQLMLLYHERIAARALRNQRAGRVVGPILGMATEIEWRPFGVVGAIGPWNYPFFNTFLAFSSALFAGNVVVVKPSEVTPQVGRLLRTVLDPLPPGVATVIEGGADVGAALVDAPCDKISFIGSPATGRKISEAAAKHLTPVVMELGGKDASIVCDDADLDVASSGVLWGSFMNTGQTCCAIERAIVSESVADDFVDRLLDKARRLEQGEDAEIGAITFDRQFKIVTHQVEDAIRKGARVLAGGVGAGRANANGSRWFAPTIIDNISDDMAVAYEESFGPIVTITRVADDDEAVARANLGTNLTASVWSSDRGRARRIASELRAGTVTINTHGESLGGPWNPWGGVGESGFGRLAGFLGIREFTVPVAIVRNPLPKMKRLWWYPYDNATLETFRGAVDFIGKPGIATKAAAARRFVGSARRALKAKL